MITLTGEVDLFDAHIAVNLKAPFFLMQAVAADLVARQGRGTISPFGTVPGGHLDDQIADHAGESFRILSEARRDPWRSQPQMPTFPPRHSVLRMANPAIGLPA